MTLTQHDNLLAEGKAALSSGTDWQSWQDRLASENLYTNDKRALDLDVVNALNDTYGEAIQAELQASGTATHPDGLDHKVFLKIVAHRTEIIVERISHSFVGDLAQYEIPEALERNQHPLFDNETKKEIYRKWKKRGPKALDEDQRNPFAIIWGVLLMVVSSVVAINSGGQFLLIGAMVLGIYYFVWGMKRD